MEFTTLHTPIPLDGLSKKYFSRAIRHTRMHAYRMRARTSTYQSFVVL
jgi:hypothetical protein